MPFPKFCDVEISNARMKNVKKAKESKTKFYKTEGLQKNVLIC